MEEAKAATGISSVTGWLPWVGLIVAAGVVGGALGPLGLLGHDTTEVLAGPTSTALLDREATATECIGGAIAAVFPAGERVLAVERSDDSAFLGVRDPYFFGSIVWVGADQVTLDGDPVVQDLPVGGLCPEVSTVLAGPPHAEVEEQAPAPLQPNSDPLAPIISGVTSDKAPSHTFYNDELINVLVTATDNVGVTGVTYTVAGPAGAVAHSGSCSATGPSGQWECPFSVPTEPFGDYTFTLRARDAVGNSSSPVLFTVHHNFFG